MSGHDSSDDVPAEEQDGLRRRDAAEEARTLVAAVTVGYLASVGENGDPWCSLVVYGPDPEGNPVLLVSTMAEHGRNLAGDPLKVPAPAPDQGG